MTRTAVRQEEQVQPSETYLDNVAPSLANYETNTSHAEDDFNNLRSMVHNLLKLQSGNWYDDIATPTTFVTESPAQRGIDGLGQDLWDIQRQRVLKRRAVVGADVGPIAVNAQHVVLSAAGELPGNTTAAVGAVTTRGTVVAYEASFNTATLTEVAGGDTLTPKNLCLIIDSGTRDPIVDGSGREVYGLLQSESSTDGHTIGTTTPNRVQISFVVANSTGDDLELAAAGVMDGKTIDYKPTERWAFEEIPEHAWLGDDFTDTGAASQNRQGVYDNQGVVPVDLTNNAILDLEGAGLAWRIRDDLEANLFSVIEGSAGGTSEIEFGTDVDVFDNDAQDNDFASQLKVDTGGEPIHIGVTAGHVESTGSNDLHLQAANEMFLDDDNQTGSTWAQTDGIKLSETTQEWDDFETEFGEVSLLNAIVQAAQSGVTRCKAVAEVSTGNIAANTLIEGPNGPGTANISADLCDYRALTFTSDVDIFINGLLQRNGADAAANHDVYPSAVAAERQYGCFYAEYTLKYRGGTRPDVITMLAWGDPVP